MSKRPPVLKPSHTVKPHSLISCRSLWGVFHKSPNKNWVTAVLLSLCVPSDWAGGSNRRRRRRRGNLCGYDPEEQAARNRSAKRVPTAGATGDGGARRRIAPAAVRGGCERWQSALDVTSEDRGAGGFAAECCTAASSIDYSPTSRVRQGGGRVEAAETTAPAPGPGACRRRRRRRRANVGGTTAIPHERGPSPPPRPPIAAAPLLSTARAPRVRTSGAGAAVRYRPPLKRPGRFAFVTPRVRPCTPSSRVAPKGVCLCVHRPWWNPSWPPVCCPRKTDGAAGQSAVRPCVRGGAFNRRRSSPAPIVLPATPPKPRPAAVVQSLLLSVVRAYSGRFSFSSSIFPSSLTAGHTGLLGLGVRFPGDGRDRHQHQQPLPPPSPPPPTTTEQLSVRHERFGT